MTDLKVSSSPKLSSSSERASDDSTSPSTASLCGCDKTDAQVEVPVTNKLLTQADLEKCAEIPIFDANGNSRPFKSLYQNDGSPRRHLIIFIRHFFCGYCQEYLRTLSASLPPSDLSTLPILTTITVIGCGQPSLISFYASATSCPYPIFVDPSRALYAHLGMARTLNLGPKRPAYAQQSLLGTMVSGIVQGLGQGRRGFSGGDFWQVGGEVLVEGGGEVTWCHRMRNTRDHAEVEVLRKVVGLEGGEGPIARRGWWGSGIREFGRRSVDLGRRGSWRGDRKGSGGGGLKRWGSGRGWETLEEKGEVGVVVQ